MENLSSIHSSSPHSIALEKAISHICDSARDMASRHIIAENATLLEALNAINSLSGDSMTLFAVDCDGRACGTVTDGDIRRAIISGMPLDTPVSMAMHRNFRRLSPDSAPHNVIKECRKLDIDLLPSLKEGFIEEIIDLRRIKTSLPIDAVLMAGGKGERLRPLTLTTPKPLLKVGSKAIIDYNVDELAANGVKNIFVTVNYLKEQIIEHFSTPKVGCTVRCVEEPRRLGTIGSLSLVEGLTKDNLLLMNSDILTNMSFENMFLQHISNNAEITMAVVPYTVSVPFAILNTEGLDVKGLAEKPTYNYLANAGVYLIRRELVNMIPKGEYLDAPDFIENVIADGGKVQYFLADATWIDIGSPDDYRYANELMSRNGI